MGALTTLLTATVLLQQPAASPPARDWIVVLAAPVYEPDGTVRAETIGLPTTGPGLVHVFSRNTICAPAAGGANEPPDAAFGWRVASTIVTRTDKDVVVSLDWRRLWEKGKKVTNGPSGTVQLTLHPGDRIPLDHIPNAKPAPDCRAVGLGLEVRLARTAVSQPASPNVTLPLGATPGGARPVNAELWLTHKLPTGSEQVLHQLVRLTEAGGKFSFAPISFATSREDISVELTGTIDRFRSPTGAEFLLVAMNRTVAGATLPASGVGGTTSSVVPMPTTVDDVLEFEMTGAAAGARGGGGGGRGGMRSAGSGSGGGARGGGDPGVITPVQRQGGAGAGAAAGGAISRGTPNVNLLQLATLLEGHQFSLRLRITPVN